MPPRLLFYVPSPPIAAAAPSSIRDYWPWIHGAVAAAPAALPDGQGPCTWFGPYNWTIQTFLYLHEAGVPCQLVATLPESGIVVAHGDFLPARLQPSPRRFIVELKPDRALRCADANFVIVQNPRDPIRHGLRAACIASAAVNYWPQPGLIPRHPGRGGRFENVCFMGNADQFMPGAEALETALAGLGLRWQMPPRDRWHDYHDADAIVALRRPASTIPKERDPYAFSPERKPASKLTNAWLAGVPAVLSPDVAFRDLRQHALDYLEAASIADAVRQVQRLRDEPGLRAAMVDNGRQRAGQFTPAAMVRQWTTLIDEEIAPRFAAWSRSRTRRLRFRLSRGLATACGVQL